MENQAITTPKQAAMASGRASTGDTVATMLRAQWKSLQLVVPKHVTPERLAKVALVGINRNAQLLECSPASIVESIINAATLGLEVNDGTGRAYLVPFKGKAQLIIGYQGLIELAYNSGRVETIAAYPVFEGDEWEWRLGLNPDITHVPCGETDGKKLTHAYAVVRLRGGGVVFEVMTRRQIDNIKARSKTSGRSDSPWNSDYVEMARKTVLRRVCKLIPKSAELVRAVVADEEVDLGLVPSAPPPSVVEQVTDAPPDDAGPPTHEEVEAMNREPGQEG